MKRKPDMFEISLGVLFLLGMLFVYFTSGKPSGAGVALLDLNGVAQQLGRDATINQALEEQKANLDTHLNNLRTSLEKELAAKKEEFGESPTEEQQNELQDIEKELNTKVTQADQQSQQALIQHQHQLLNDFSNEVRPVAMEIAAKRGALWVVLYNPAMVFTADRSLDITNEVIVKLRSSVLQKGLERSGPGGPE